jgi:Cdc6-like AAA superfamily ATPase
MTEKATEPGQIREDESGISRHKILVAGSRWIQENNYDKISQLAKMIGAKIMDEENWILLNNGASETSPKGISSIDHLVSDGALDELRKTNNLKAEKERILTLHPQKTDHNLHSIGKVEIAGATPHLRRIESVKQADIIITIEGGFGTKEIIELIAKSKKPFLPIACTGGESAKAWKDSEEYILQTFGIEKQSEEYEMLTTKGLDDPSGLSDHVIKIIKGKLEPALIGTVPIDTVPIDTVPTLVDNPSKIDQLDRKTFAQALTRRIDNLYFEDGVLPKAKDNEEKKEGKNILLHIYGRWGSGKTTVLNFMKEELKDKSRRRERQWIVVEFNAWQHQHIVPPWWPLMDAVYKQSVKQLPLRRSAIIRLRENLWRLWVGRSRYLLVPAILLGVLGIVGLLSGTFDIAEMTKAMQNAPDFVKYLNTKLGAVIALIVSLVTAARALDTSLLPGSARAAQEFTQLTSDPMQKLKTHFNNMINHIEQPIVIFIDDLDRCRESYTVELLEGIQTLFREANIVYVVAADRHWISASYEKAYDTFLGAFKESGRPLGYLFLEKTFQVSTPIPHISSTLQQEYWNKLIQSKGNPASQVQQFEEIEKVISEKAGEEYKTIQGLSESEIYDEVNKGRPNSLDDIALRRAVIHRLTTPEMNIQTEHFLKPFALFMEPNPRAMKRLLNAYTLARDVLILQKTKHLLSHRKQLALWTILTLRWPPLAEFLSKNPEEVKKIKDMNEESFKKLEVPEDIKKLFKDKEVISVVSGKVDLGKVESDVKANINPQAIELFRGDL